ncbi:collectin-46-like isoform X2 [Homalodisca vitripennis]|uniref:collectin-46-like isoform X2 n=1 Tax=Homalodisca vitripennis TaxID=197043 RepID=UPI001EECAD4D|nr:collectin-46-like isoform X2 [Homalodisca vitripennis]
MSHVLLLCLLTNVVCVFGQNYDSVSPPQCIGNGDCGVTETCVNLSCRNPCPGTCQGNAKCEVHDHVPYCSCKPGFSGDPFTGCRQDTPNCTPSGSSCGKKVYRVERFIKVNWYAALIHCKDHGGALATIRSREENERIKEEIRKTALRNDRFWTSGTNYPQGHWVWMSTGDTLPDFTDWLPGEPNNDGCNENCLNFFESHNQGYMWNDAPCTTPMYPICEYFVQ